MGSTFRIRVMIASLGAALLLGTLPTSAVAAKEYVLKHPKREHCKAHYVRKTKTVRKKIHGHGVKVHETVCVHKTSRTAAPVTPTTSTVASPTAPRVVRLPTSGKCPPGYTAAPPNCVKFEGTGRFHAGSPFASYEVQFSQQTTEYEIQFLGGGEIFPVPPPIGAPGCHEETVTSTNDAFACPADTPANTTTEGKFVAFRPPAEPGTKFEIYGVQGGTKFGPFGPFAAM
jgi:hypothetical protein